MAGPSLEDGGGERATHVATEPSLWLTQGFHNPAGGLSSRRDSVACRSPGPCCIAASKHSTLGGSGPSCSAPHRNCCELTPKRLGCASRMQPRSTSGTACAHLLSLNAGPDPLLVAASIAASRARYARQSVSGPTTGSASGIAEEGPSSLPPLPPLPPAAALAERAQCMVGQAIGPRCQSNGVVHDCCNHTTAWNSCNAFQAIRHGHAGAQ